MKTKVPALTGLALAWLLAFLVVDVVFFFDPAVVQVLIRL